MKTVSRSLPFLLLSALLLALIGCSGSARSMGPQMSTSSVQFKVGDDRGILDSALTVGHHSVHLVPVNVPWEDRDAILGILSGVAPEVVVLSASFQDEVRVMRTRSRWPPTVGVVAAIAAGLGDFSAELEQVANGVVGPSQWEPGGIFPDTVGPGSDWFLDSFQRKFGQAPNYIAAGSFAGGLVLSECIQLCSSLVNEKVRDAAADLDCNTFYGRFHIELSNRNTDRPQCVAYPLA